MSTSYEKKNKEKHLSSSLLFIDKMVKLIKYVIRRVVMIGLGKWTGNIETSMLKGSAVVEIKDNNGEYAFSVETDSLKTIPNFTVYDIVENGNTLSGKADIELMGKITVDIFVEFTSDTTFIGYIKVPFFGKFEIKDGRKIG
jgi:hypothetical protein